MTTNKQRHTLFLSPENKNTLHTTNKKTSKKGKQVKHTKTSNKQAQQQHKQVTAKHHTLQQTNDAKHIKHTHTPENKNTLHNTNKNKQKG